MRVDLMRDVATPVLVGAADIGLSWWDERRLADDPNAIAFEPIAGVIGAVGGYGMMVADLWPETAKVVAHAATPWAVRAIYNWIREQMGTPVARRATARPMSASPVARPVSSIRQYPAPAQRPEFQFAPAF